MAGNSEIPFLWGASTSSHQVEGNNKNNDWWQWEQAGKVKERSGAACDQYRLFREDIALISGLGHTAHRFSLEWSRLEPEENVWNEESFRHYEEFFKELQARNIEPIVTLHHFTNPVWFAKKGGWLNPECVQYFVRYSERVAKVFGKYVRFWVTINEPLIYLYHSYYAGLWPPGLLSFSDSLKVFKNLLLGHFGAYQKIHHVYETSLQRPVAVSFAQYMIQFSPCRPESWKDCWAAYWRSWFVNDAFLEAVHTGFLFFPGIFCELLPSSRALDYLAINYYSRDFVRFGGWIGEKALGDACSKDHHKDQVQELNVMGWEIYPDGLYQILMRLKRFGLPMMVTENGICAADDEQRVRFIRSHLGAVKRARQDGAPIFGYLHWSLLDNFEWAHGFGPRFGIVEVNYENQQRKVRQSAQVLTETCRNI